MAYFPSTVQKMYAETLELYKTLKDKGYEEELVLNLIRDLGLLVANLKEQNSEPWVSYSHLERNVQELTALAKKADVKKVGSLLGDVVRNIKFFSLEPISIKDFINPWREEDFYKESKDFETFIEAGVMPYLVFGKNGINKKFFRSFRFQYLPLADEERMQNKVATYMAEHFPKEKISCLYPGGGFRVEHFFSYMDPDVLIILDPDPSMHRRTLTSEELIEKYKKVVKSSLDAELAFEETFSIQEKSVIEFASNLQVRFRFHYLGKERTLYVITRGAGEEFYEGSPLRHKVHLIFTRLPVFDTFSSYAALRKGGLFISATPSRDGPDIRGDWGLLIDYEQVPILIRKEGVFEEREKIELLQKFVQSFDELFMNRKFNFESFAKQKESIQNMIGDEPFNKLWKDFEKSGAKRLECMLERLKSLIFLPKETLREIEARLSTIQANFSALFSSE